MENTDLAKFLNDQFSALWDAMNENSARLSAQRFLLEQLYANAFLDDPAGLSDMLNGMIERTRSKPKTEPMAQDDLLELQARTATHLERFQNDVLRRIQGAGRG